MNDSLKLLLIADMHCVGDREYSFSRIVGEGKSTREIQRDLGALLQRLFHEVDFVIVAGDFTDSGQTHQYEAVMSVLADYDPKRFCVIPGNHDVANISLLDNWNAKMRRFKYYLRSQLTEFPEAAISREYFPYIRQLGKGFVLIGLDSTLAGTAQGRIGPRQLDRLDKFLSNDEYADKHKIVLLHHDIAGDTKLFSGFEIHYGNVLTDKEAFINVISTHAQKTRTQNITLICGHTHLKKIDTEMIPNVNMITAPSFGSRFEEDYMAIELFQDGSFQEIFKETRNNKSRILRKYGKYIIPRIHT